MEKLMTTEMCQKLEDLAKMLDDMRAQVNMQQDVI